MSRNLVVMAVAITFGAAIGAAACRNPSISSTTEDTRPPEPEAEADPSAYMLTHARVYSLAWPDPSPRGVPHANAPFDAGQWRPDADSVIIRGGSIVAVGSETELRRNPEWSKVAAIDLAGATVLPGFVDSHTHILELGLARTRPDLRHHETVASMVEHVGRAAANLSGPDQWLFAGGFDEGAWANAYPGREDLDAVVPERPVYVRGLHGFAGWLNSAALRTLGIDDDTPDPVGGTIVRDETGRATGIVLNNAVDMVDDALPPLDRASSMAAIEAGLADMARSGFVGIHEAGADARAMEAFEALAREQRLSLRVYAMLRATDAELLDRWRERGPSPSGDDRLVVRAVKAYYDGSLGARGAALLADYADRPGHRGVRGHEYAFDPTRVAAMADAGFQLAIHAIGDLGNREVLDFLATLDPRRDSRHRIEHAQVLAPDDLLRLAPLEIIASMQAVHCVEDMPWVHDRIGPERARGAYAWRTLRSHGTALTLNSDLPGSDHDLFYGLHAAVTRQDRQGRPSGGFHPQERLTIEEAIRGYTSWSAHAGFDEESAGTLEAGKRADLTIIDIDPFVTARESARDLLRGRVMMTIIAGSIVYDARPSLPSDPAEPG